MRTEDLRLFVLAAEKLNISAAGRVLGLAPAVASSKLAKLENLLGADLLHRSTRRVSLSVEGSEFLPYAREIISQEDAAMAALGRGSDQIRGTLRFAAPCSFAQLYIIPLLPEFLARFPELTLDLKLSDLAFDPIEGSFDLALRNAALADSSLRARRLAEDSRVLCASPLYLEARGEPQQPEDLRNHSLVAFGNPTSRKLRSSAGVTSDLEFSAPNTRLVVDDGRSQVLATLAGAGISMNSRWIIHDYLKRGDLVRVLPDYEVADDANLWLVYPRSNVLSPKVRVLIDFLMEKIAVNPPWD
ncbi:MAG: LysR family transcriptional regulator [Pseudomonadota bacterium]